MKALNIVEMILGIILTILGVVGLVAAIITKAGLDSIVVGGLFTLSGIVAILNTIFNLKSLKK